jgi:hypothetical protein
VDKLLTFVFIQMKKQGSEAVDLLSLPQPKKHKKKAFATLSSVGKSF